MRIDWINPTNKRFYVACLQADLFGSLYLDLRWGSTESKRHGGKTHCVSSMQDGQELIKVLDKRRVRRGYIRI